MIKENVSVQFQKKKKIINHCSSRLKVVFSLCLHHTRFSHKVRGSHGFQVAKLGKEGTKKPRSAKNECIETNRDVGLLSLLKYVRVVGMRDTI